MHITSLRVGINRPGEDKYSPWVKAEVEVSLMPGDDYETVKKEALAEVESILSAVEGGTSKPSTKTTTRRAIKGETTTEEKSGDAPAEEKPKRRARRSAVKDETKEEAPAKEEKKEDDEPKEEKPKRSRRAPAKSKITKYSRDEKAHKKIFRSVVDEQFPGWDKDDELKPLVKEASVASNGEDMLGEDGAVLDSFVDAVCKMVEGDDL